MLNKWRKIPRNLKFYALVSVVSFAYDTFKEFTYMENATLNHHFGWFVVAVLGCLIFWGIFAKRNLARLSAIALAGVAGVMIVARFVSGINFALQGQGIISAMQTHPFFIWDIVLVLMVVIIQLYTLLDKRSSEWFGTK